MNIIKYNHSAQTTYSVIRFSNYQLVTCVKHYTYCLFGENVDSSLIIFEQT